jgi:hypothetical protein
MLKLNAEFCATMLLQMSGDSYTDEPLDSMHIG